MLSWILNALTSRQTDDGVDVQALIGNHPGGCLYLTGFQLATHHHEDVTVLALMAYPVFVLIVADG